MALSNKEREGNKKNLIWIYKICKKYLSAIAVITVFSAIVSLTTVALALLSKDVLDVATGNKEGSFAYYGILLLFVIVLQIVLHITDVLLKTFCTEKITISIRNRLFTSISRRKYSEISEYHSGDLLNRLTSDTEVVTSAVVNIIPNIASMVSRIIGGIAALLVLDKRIALLILVFGITVPAFGRLISRKYKQVHKDCQKSEGKTRAFMQECFENVVVLKAFEGEAPFTKKLNQYMSNTYSFKMKRSGISVITNMGLYSFFTVGYYAVLIWGASKIAGGIITFGTLTAFLQLFENLRGPLQSVSGILPQYFSAMASTERLIEIDDGNMDKPFDNKLKNVFDNFESIDLKNVTFAYKDEAVLNNKNLRIEKGKITAIVGESGSGKSTIFKLLLGLYEPQEGEITVNGNIPLDTSLRSLFAYVPQGNLILSGTVRENITICNEDVTEQEIIDACKAAEIYNIISQLPNGFETELSERGAGLSEGQLQRISIARALLTKAPVLLLDEATSALDEMTETKVLDNIKKMENKTVIFVTHRNTSLKVCDEVIKIKKQ